MSVKKKEVPAEPQTLFDELMLYDPKVDTLKFVMTGDQITFVKLHKQVISSGNLASSYMVQLAKALKEIKDKRLYAVAGFASFGEYAESAVGIKERQAYTYVSVIEAYSEDFLQSTAKLGITKLGILSEAVEADREMLIESGVAESSSTRELREKIKELEAEKQKNDQLIDDLADEKETLQSVRDGLIAERDKYKQQAAKAAEQVKPNIDNKQLEKLEADKSKLEAERDKLKKDLADLKAAPAKVKEIDNPKTAAELEKTNAKLKAAEAALEATNKKLSIAADENMFKFKVKFEDFQALLYDLIDLIGLLDEEKSAKCRAALTQIIRESEL